MRFRGLYPHQLKRFKMHGDRKGGDLSHIDVEKSGFNQILIGSQTWIEDLNAEIQAVSAINLKEVIAARKARQRPTEAAALKRRGPVDPWAKSKEGPLREGILTASSKWFGGSGIEAWDPAKVSAFRDLAVAFLRDHFGETCVHARMDMDEEALHIHFVVAPWTEKHSKSSGCHRLLQPSSNPLFASYEHAQNLAGDHFAKLGLIRGEKHAENRRKAKAANLPLPKPVQHIPPTRWRLEQKAQLKRVHEALKAKQFEIATAQAKLQDDHDQLKAKRAKLKEVWHAQQSIAAQVAEREARITADAELLAALWQQAGKEVPSELTRICQQIPRNP
ncbi:hypothetical protein ACSBLW_08790 [Thioclava sp. FR2]|uniref:plasmid recombination protein n=1 Tax=Thioclava sp. FR2 TaxID=3445780 RepID=UPI003EBC43A7